ncbi:VWA domain-containing protein [Pseudonocardia ailaonensis]|uniref:VWA domain-containing protein n=1 Tax=Pseudonocardia ailaonensis TaxID=367279 RepID=UPI0031D17303
MRLALLLNAVHDGIGGVLVRGEKGTAKSTAVRALAALLPAVSVVGGCRFSCDPAAPDPGCPDCGPRVRGAAARAWETGADRADGAAAEVGGGSEGGGPVDRPARLVELPVGATEDRLAGSLDLERALADGTRAYQPGLLAEAHRGVLYVDEVNLLHDHLVDLLLDAAAMGRVHVERDGVSVSHASRFLLVGTMNPEEGELRPQLLDRFGLTVAVRAAREVGTRVEVVRRRMAYEADPAGFARSWEPAEREVAAQVVAARSRLGSVVLSDRELSRIAFVCARFDVDGMRADLVISRTAVAHAAWRAVAAVEEEDVRIAALLALPHRRRRDPFDEPGLDEKDLDQALRDAEEYLGPDPDDDPDGSDASDNSDDSDASDGDPDPGDGAQDGAGDGAEDGTEGGSDGGAGSGGADGRADAPRDSADPDTGPTDAEDRAPDPRTTDGSAPEQPLTSHDRPDVVGAGAAVQVGTPGRLSRVAARRFTVPGVGEGAPGRRSRARVDTGRVVRPTDAAPRRAADLHLLATIAAAAPHQRDRGRTGRLRVAREDLRGSVREGREGNLVLFVVDASGSMAARRRMEAVSGAILALLRDAYQRRDKVGLVTFRSAGAELVLPPTTSVPTAQVRMRSMRTGGRTPLADGLLLARKVLTAERVRDPRRRPLVVLLTDGRATVPARAGGDPVADARRAAALLAADGTHTVVVDCESGFVRLGLARDLAAAAGAAHLAVDDLTVSALTTAVSA